MMGEEVCSSCIQEGPSASIIHGLASKKLGTGTGGMQVMVSRVVTWQGEGTHTYCKLVLGNIIHTPGQVASSYFFSPFPGFPFLG